MARVRTVEAAAAALAALAREDDSTGEQSATGRSWLGAWSYAADHAPTSDDRGVLDTCAFATWYAAGNGGGNLAGAFGEYLATPTAAWLLATHGPG